MLLFHFKERESEQELNIHFIPYTKIVPNVLKTKAFKSIEYRKFTLSFTPSDPNTQG